MKLLSNWQQLLISQITQGTFFMSPQIYVSSIPQFQKYLDLKTDDISELNYRGDFSIMALSDHGDSYSRYDEAPEGSIAVFQIMGAMFKYGTWWQYGTVEIAAFIREAINHKNISAIVLDFDSGGGSGDSISPLLQVIAEAKALGIPVVAKINMCASAAYYTASACDYIVADNSISATVGSIGVMTSMIDLKPYYEKLGIAFHDIYADQSDYKNQPFILAMKGEYEMIKKEWLNPMAIAFQEHVKTSRKGKLDESIDGILAGRTFFADQSLQYGLIDEIGDEFTALEKARQFAEVRNSISNLNLA